ncbi:MAG: hypothetical protein JWN34_1630 [Bryobacterales bacterium]|nr:hypothetical protein [Bryobacterales bacterium]
MFYRCRSTISTWADLDVREVIEYLPRDVVAVQLWHGWRCPRPRSKHVQFSIDGLTDLYRKGLGYQHLYRRIPSRSGRQANRRTQDGSIPSNAAVHREHLRMLNRHCVF